MQGVIPLAPATIPQLGGAEPDLRAVLDGESLYETIQLVTQLRALYKKYNSNILVSRGVIQTKAWLPKCG